MPPTARVANGWLQRVEGLLLVLVVMVLTAGGAVVGTSRASTPLAQVGQPQGNQPQVEVAEPSPQVARPSAAPRRIVAPLRPRRAQAQQPADPWARFGFDISWPQCAPGGPVLPPLLGPMAFVGVSGGRPMTENRCLAAEWRWAQGRAQRAGYVNLAAPAGGQDPVAYGAATVRYALEHALLSGVSLRGLWLDVEVGNHWTDDASVNAAVIRGAAVAAQQAGVQPGVYSSRLDWRIITGDARLYLPEWEAIADGRKLAAACAEPGFGGRAPDVVQAVFFAAGHDVDGNLRCTDDAALLRLLSLPAVS